jgi:hypothetical protein
MPRRKSVPRAVRSDLDLLSLDAIYRVLLRLQHKMYIYEQSYTFNAFTVRPAATATHSLEPVLPPAKFKPGINGDQAILLISHGDA